MTELALVCVQGFVGRALGEPGLKPTVRVGEAAMREVAAFLLDYSHFAHVPHTVFGKHSDQNSLKALSLNFTAHCQVSFLCWQSNVSR